MFITFEGIEGSGKSTQAKMLFTHLGTLSPGSCVLTREPGGTFIGERVRDILLEGDGIDDVKAEYLLFAGARRYHVASLILPALKQGKTIISDRFIDSSFVYQSYVKGLSERFVQDVYEYTNDGLWPDLTFVMDVDPSIAMARCANRGECNAYDVMDLSFHSKVRAGFLKHAKRFPKRIIVLDASLDTSIIAKKVVKKYEEMLSILRVKRENSLL